MKGLFLSLLAVAIFIAVVGFYSKPTSNLLTPKENVTTKEVVIGKTTIDSEIADTDSERRKGLSGRESLCGNCGMLFVFPEGQKRPNFWMKDMNFAIDIIWIAEGKIVDLDKNVPAPDEGVKDADLTLYSIEEKVDYVLEVNAGFAEGNGIEVGNFVTLPEL